MTRIGRDAMVRLAHLPTSQIAERLGVTERTVQRALNELRADGFPVPHGRTRNGTAVLEVIVHGTNGYRHGCRCAECRLANAENMRAQRVQRKTRGLPPGDPRHGTDYGAANWGCSCPKCRAAYIRRNNRQKARAGSLAR